MSTGIRVLKSGIHATLQDQGRYGFQHLGVTPGGPADGVSANWANRLLDNGPECAVIEITAGGTELESHTHSMVAVTGGDLNLTVNGQPKAPWRSFWVQPGDVLKFGYPRYGFRAYVAVQGGFHVPQVLGSGATVARNNLGGLKGDGSHLQPNDFIPCAATSQERVPRQMPDRFVPDLHSELTLSVIPGYQQHDFSADSWQTFWSSEYEISAASDSMGARLQGPALACPAGNLLSEPVCYGAIQVPGDGQPIILLQQRQTLGGYPKLGSILPLSGYNLAQRPPGSKVRFKPMGLATAQQQMRRYLRFFGL